MKEKLKAFIKKGKWLGSASFTAILIILVVMLYITANILVEKIEPQYIDLTSQKLYSLSQESKDKISNIKNDTKIILYGMSNYPEVEEFAKLYSNQNEKISYEILSDTNTRSDLVEKYGIGTSTESLIVVECDKNSKALTTSDLYSMDYSSNESIDITEQALTNAILAVNLEKTPKIYFAEDHAYYNDQYTVAQEYLKNEANEVENLSIVQKGGIPEDCDVLVITTLSEDLSEFETNEILAYINNGGKLMILADPNFGRVELTNFNKILSEYGVSLSTGAIFESNSANMISGYADMILPNINEDSSITKYISKGVGVVFMSAGKIEENSNINELNVTKTDLIYAKDTAFLRNDGSITSNSKVSTDEDASGAVMGTLLDKKITKENGEEVNSQLILYSNSIFASDLGVTLYGTKSNSTSQKMGIMFYNNKDLVINSISYLTQRTDNVTIRKDTGTIYTFSATEKQVTIIKTIIIALPILILLLGIIVWQIRRRKK